MNLVTRAGEETCEPAGLLLWSEALRPGEGERRHEAHFRLERPVQGEGWSSGSAGWRRGCGRRILSGDTVSVFVCVLRREVFLVWSPEWCHWTVGDVLETSSRPLSVIIGKLKVKDVKGFVSTAPQTTF